MAIRTFACLAFLLISGLASAAQPKDRVVRNSIGMTFVQVPSGQFMMGSLATKPEAARDEQPRRAVRITKSFYLGMFEVTQQEYEKVMGNDPSSYSVLMPGKIRERADMIVTRDSCFPLSANLKESIGAEIASLDGVESVTPGLVDFMAVGELGEPVGIQGLPAGNRIFGDLKILRGECLAAKHKGKKGVLVGENLARVYKLKPSDELTLSDEKFRIVGVYRSGFEMENSMVFMLLEDSQRILGKSGLITGLALRIKRKSPEAVKVLQAQIEGPIAEKLGLKGRIRASTNTEYYVQARAGRDFRFPPVENVSWNDAQEYCRRLSALPAEKAAGRRYRLPTEAEWEYAARAGSTDGLSTAEVNHELNEAAWYAANSLDRPHSVGQKALNAWGLCDMHGNVAEWCADAYAADYYAKSPSDDPAGPAAAETRVIRGGSWNHPASACRPAARASAKPDARSANVGFRVVLEMKPNMP